ncbi:helix-turn-helix transcriptional regulator [Bacillus atrophaeus]|uniref:helix-turn-helix domain-containing protein n=1 Tax=Bacillus atrophaeus TaxID=1452 RepID=UPI002281CE83|nr:helix-turn-helix transcriptional regulator [Bacillus atrophaeus]MCY7947896.1 helix-turn-helix transcriptional regulator [Bacillus atrophaeus]MCY8098375.1 helix-turn-helix transcriptional regulator [Bacillus atrophaeus]MCY9167892.1 helix-turn-helix transcriptional regulator [Bacillus atrophaeus]MEC0741833.1 helix-turn-helix transcriptional regulator [Bacillus atrophaeus]MEC0744853.1 helix-turn-helix transcriptional regulator [Bacillus atrophaeus]
MKSNLKPILDERKISIRQLSRDIDHEYPTVRKLYKDEMERYQTSYIRIMQFLLCKEKTVDNVRYCARHSKYLTP